MAKTKATKRLSLTEAAAKGGILNIVRVSDQVESTRVLSYGERYRQRSSLGMETPVQRLQRLLEEPGDTVD